MEKVLISVNKEDLDKVGVSFKLLKNPDSIRDISVEDMRGNFIHMLYHMNNKNEEDKIIVSLGSLFLRSDPEFITEILEAICETKTVFTSHYQLTKDDVKGIPYDLLKKSLTYDLYGALFNVVDVDDMNDIDFNVNFDMLNNSDLIEDERLPTRLFLEDKQYDKIDARILIRYIKPYMNSYTNFIETKSEYYDTLISKSFELFIDNSTDHIEYNKYFIDMMQMLTTMLIFKTTYGIKILLKAVSKFKELNTGLIAPINNKSNRIRCYSEYVNFILKEGFYVIEELYSLIDYGVSISLAMLGVISKYPVEFCKLIDNLLDKGEDVYDILDSVYVYDCEFLVKFISDKNIGIVASRVKNLHYLIEENFRYLIYNNRSDDVIIDLIEKGYMYIGKMDVDYIKNASDDLKLYLKLKGSN